MGVHSGIRNGSKEVDASTKDAEEDESKSGHEADREPTSEEEAAADGAKPDADELADVARHEHEMNELGSDAKGEGQIV